MICPGCGRVHAGVCQRASDLLARLNRLAESLRELRAQVRAVRRVVVLAVVAGYVLTGCSLVIRDGTPDTYFAKRASQRRACEQAYEQGWCYDACRGRRQPAKCCEPKNVQCGPDGLCMWEGCDGALIFGTGK